MGVEGDHVAPRVGKRAIEKVLAEAPFGLRPPQPRAPPPGVSLVPGPQRVRQDRVTLAVEAAAGQRPANLPGRREGQPPERAQGAAPRPLVDDDHSGHTLDPPAGVLQAGAHQHGDFGVGNAAPDVAHELADDEGHVAQPAHPCRGETPRAPPRGARQHAVGVEEAEEQAAGEMHVYDMVAPGMRILLVTPLFFPSLSGAAVYFDTLSQAIVRRQPTASVVILTRAVAGAPRRERRGAVRVLRLLPAAGPPGTLRGGRIGAALSALMILLVSLALRSDVVHYHTLASYRGLHRLAPLFRAPAGG